MSELLVKLPAADLDGDLYVQDHRARRMREITPARPAWGRAGICQRRRVCWRQQTTATCWRQLPAGLFWPCAYAPWSRSWPRRRRTPLSDRLMPELKIYRMLGPPVSCREPIASPNLFPAPVGQPPKAGFGSTSKVWAPLLKRF